MRVYVFETFIRNIVKLQLSIVCFHLDFLNLFHPFFIQVISAKIPANDGITVSFPIKPTKLGMVDLNVRAESNVAGDALSQPLLVKVGGALWHRLRNRGGGGGGGGAEPPQYFEWGGWSILEPPKKSYILIKSLTKKGLKLCKFSPPNIKYSYTAPLPLPKIVYICVHFDRKGNEIVHLWFHPYTFSYEKKGCPLQQPDIYFCKLRPKRA